MKQIIVLLAFIALGIAMGATIMSFSGVFDDKADDAIDSIEAFDTGAVTIVRDITEWC